MLDGSLVVAYDPHLLISLVALGSLVVFKLSDQLLILPSDEPQLVLQLLVAFPQQFHLFCHRTHVLISLSLLLLL